MLKRTIVVSNPAFLKKQDEQLIIKRENDQEDSVPIEDIGVLLLDNRQITITQACLSAILANNGIIINCDHTHHPDGILLPVAGNTVHAEILRAQLESSLPLRKQLWQQTIKAKILAQAFVLHSCGSNPEPLEYLASKVRSGDPENIEGRAAAHYWKNLFPPSTIGGLKFTRERFGNPPNNLLNYGYSVMRASMARAVVSAGLHPAVGIHHKNRYNAFSLADDLMEPYRPFVDIAVHEIVVSGEPYDDLNPDLKRRLLLIFNDDVFMEGERRPLQLALMRTATSLTQTFQHETDSISYPEIHAPE